MSTVCTARQALSPASPLLWPRWLWAPAWLHCSCVQKPLLTKVVFSYNAACRHSLCRGRKEGRGWFWDWGPGLAFRNCSAAAQLHSVKHAVYLLSFLCPSALAQGVENEKSAVGTLGLLHWVTVSRYTRDVVMSMDLLVEGGRATNRVEALPFLMLHVCF